MDLHSMLVGGCIGAGITTTIWLIITTIVLERYWK